MKLFKSKDVNSQALSLSAFFPQGRAFNAKNLSGKNLQKFINGLAGELARVYDDMNNISEDYDILVTDELLNRWESSVGIPDNVFPGTGSNAIRRLHVLLKFAKMNVQTAQEMQQLIVALGFADAQVYALQDVAYPPYNVPFIPTSGPGSRYIIVVKATGALLDVPPYNVPFTPRNNDSSVLSQIMEIIKPANVQVQFVNA